MKRTVISTFLICLLMLLLIAGTLAQVIFSKSLLATLMIALALLGFCALSLLQFLHERKKASAQQNFSLLLYAIACFVLCVWFVYLAIRLFDAGESLDGTIKDFQQVAGSIKNDNIVADNAEQISSLRTIVLVSQILLYALQIGNMVVLGTVTRFLPKLFLRYSTAPRKYLFSALTEESVCLAESIAKKYPHKQVDLVFFDIAHHTDDTYAALSARARRIHASLMEDDIRHQRFSSPQIMEYFLINKDRDENIMLAGELTTTYRSIWEQAQKVNMYLFSQSPEAGRLVGQLYRQYEDHPAFQKLTIKVTPDSTNMIYHLLDTYPLYLPLLAPNRLSDDSALHLLLVGEDENALEFFRAVYWCGQLLNPRTKKELPLCIDVICEQPDVFRDRIAAAMPDLFPNTKEGYADIHFHAAVCGSGRFDEILEKQCPQTDYAFLSLGSDSANQRCAQRIATRLNRFVLGSTLQPQIHFVIENEALSAILRDSNKNGDGVLLHPMGCIRERFSYDTVLMTDLEKRAWAANKTHNENTYRQFIIDEYSRRQSTLSALHFKYKLFDLGALQTLEDADNVYSETVLNRMDLALRDSAVQNALIWSEHRRWNAATRSIGMRCPTAEEYLAYALQKGKYQGHKNLPLGFQACLVECNTNGCIRPITWEKFPRNVHFSAENSLPLPHCATANGSTPLSVWLREIVPGDPEDDLDDLDRLSLFTSFLKDAREDIKIWDLYQVQGLYRNTLLSACFGAIVEHKTETCSLFAARLTASLPAEESLELGTADGYRYILCHKDGKPLPDGAAVVSEGDIYIIYQVKN